MDHYVDKKGDEKPIFREIRFLDSCKFMASSLDKLVKNLDKDKLTSTKRYFNHNEDFELVSKKGVYPYEYMDCLEKFNVDGITTKRGILLKTHKLWDL